MLATRTSAIALLALTGFIAAWGLPNCVDEATTAATVTSPTTNMVCFSDCTNHVPNCFPTPGSNKYTETVFFTTFAVVDGSTVWKINIAVDDSSYLANFSTGATVMTALPPAVMVAHTVGSDGLIGNPLNASQTIVSGQWTGHVTVLNMETASMDTVPALGVGQSGVGYGSYHMLVTTDTSNVNSPTFGKWWLMTFSGKYEGPIFPSTDPNVAEVPTGWFFNDDGTFGRPNFAVFSVVGDDTLLTQIVEVPTPGKNYYIYTSAPPEGGGYYGIATIDFTNHVVTTKRMIPGAPYTDATGFLTPTHGALYDTFTKDVLMFGAGKIAQVDASDPAGPNFGKLKTVYQVKSTNVHFDQGSPDGRGHVFIADNNMDRIIWVSYVRSLDVSHPDAEGVVFTMPYLDDVAPLLGSGRVCPIG